MAIIIPTGIKAIPRYLVRAAKNVNMPAILTELR